MNSKIKKFIEDCTETTEIVNPETGITHHREFFDKEKFAELIVIECANFVKGCPGGALPRSIAVFLKEHFGVKSE